MRRTASLIVVVLMCCGALSGLAHMGSAHVRTDMGTLGGYYGYGSDINEYGQVVGYSITDIGSPPYQPHGFMVNPSDLNGDGSPDTWFVPDDYGNNELMVDLGSLIPNDPHAAAWVEAINRDGWIVGSGWVYGEQTHPFVVKPDGNVWYRDVNGDNVNDLMMILHNGLPPYTFLARDINNNGVIVGGTAHDAYVWPDDATGWVTLGSLGGIGTWAYAVNDNGLIVGYSTTADSVVHAFVLEPQNNGDGTYTWFVDDGSGGNLLMKDLGSFGSECIAEDINNLDVVVGHGTDTAAIPSGMHAFEWVRDGVGGWRRIDLTTSPTVQWGLGAAYGINDFGDIVGESRTVGVKPVLCKNDQMHQLDSYGYAYAINAYGQIVGHGPMSEPAIWLPGTPPTASFTASATGLSVMFDASLSSDYDGSIVSYEWNFGDFTTAIGPNKIVTHDYWTGGTYYVTLNVTDNDGMRDTIGLTIAVSAPPLQEPEPEIIELKEMIEKCHDAKGNPIDEKTKASLKLKADVALEVVGARKTGGSPAAVEARKTGGANLMIVFDGMVESYTLVGKLAGYDGWDLTCQANFVVSLLANQKMIFDVPNYAWYHGCGPTAAGMIIGYWDAHGFGGLVKGEPVLLQTPDVNNMIASPKHIAEYALYPDGKTEDTCENLVHDLSESDNHHPDDCLADYMHTSQSRVPYKLGYGLSLASMVDDALIAYTENATRLTGSSGQYFGYSKELPGASFSWADLRLQVDTQHPMVVTVDYNGDGDTDHLVTVVGYCQIGSARLYAFHSTWDNTIYWGSFEMMKKGVCYGVYSGFTFDITDVTPSQ